MVSTRSRQAIINNLQKPRTVNELAPLTGLHPFTVYRIMGEMQREGQVYVAGFIKSPKLRGHDCKLYQRR